MTKHWRECTRHESRAYSSEANAVDAARSAGVRDPHLAITFCPDTQRRHWDWLYGALRQVPPSHNSRIVTQQLRSRLEGLQRRDFGRGDPSCYLCGRGLQRARDLASIRPRPLPPDWPTIEHVVPTSRGGAARKTSNQRLACQRCNSRKGDRMIEELLDPEHPLFDPVWPIFRSVDAVRVAVAT